MPADGRDIDQWKQKYYDQLDILEQKEQAWEELEGILKRTISRLSLAAEGQHDTLDRHLSELRRLIKSTLNPAELASLVEKISSVISQLEEQSVDVSSPVSHCITQLLSQLTLPDKVEKPLKQLKKKLEKSDDKQAGKLLEQAAVIIQSAITTPATDSDQSDEPKQGIFGKLFSADKPAQSSQNDSDSTPQLEVYRQCLLHLVEELSQQSSSGRLSALAVSIRDANNQQTLDTLFSDLSDYLRKSSTSSTQTGSPDSNHQINDLQPGIQELLIRLLEQLIVPAEMQSQADDMKHRLEQETDAADWKQLLKDVANLINAIRSRLQQEKTEFESFLQQVTDRLKAMDQFLQQESEQLQEAELSGTDFDQTINHNVNEIRQDIQDATDLSTLKQSVTIKLDTISQHIKAYRDMEQQRVSQSREQVEAMHSRMSQLEDETIKLKKVVIEKNKQAMFDTLTGIPNRLSYEKKVVEEIARWTRYSTPLSLAVWDIDFFKKVNDTYGHKAGDKVLKTVAQLINKRIRATDFFARYGGEEFVMLLPDTPADNVLSLLDNLRKDVENCGFHYHGDAVTITVSCGACEFSPGDSADQVFERADQALYQAKKNGRNQCVLAPSSG